MFGFNFYVWYQWIYFHLLPDMQPLVCIIYKLHQATVSFVTCTVGLQALSHKSNYMLEIDCFVSGQLRVGER